MKKLLGIIVLGLLLSGNAHALETPMKKLSKYFKSGELIKIQLYTAKNFIEIKDGSYKNSPIEVDAFIAFPKKGEGPFPVVMFAHASGGASLFTDEWFKFNGMFISSGGYKPETAEVALNDNKADAIMFGRWFIANPDLPERIAKKAELNKYDRATFYGGDEKGYTDYPFLS